MRLMLLGLALLAPAMPASAALPLGSRAPDFVTSGALAGKPFRLHLRQQLRRGPVVLYFYPKAFTKGCTLEANAFSKAMPRFRRAGAQVIGMSGDDLPTLKRFSIEECHGAFPVAVATRRTIAAYDVAMPLLGGTSNRTSYVIDRSGRIVMVHSELDWRHHVANTLAALEAIRARPTARR